MGKTNRKIPDKFSKRGDFKWKSHRTKSVLLCNGVPVAKIEEKQDLLFDDDPSTWVVFYADRVSPPGDGYRTKDRAINSILKRFKLLS